MCSECATIHSWFRACPRECALSTLEQGQVYQSRTSLVQPKSQASHPLNNMDGGIPTVTSEADYHGTNFRPDQWLIEITIILITVPSS